MKTTSYDEYLDSHPRVEKFIDFFADIFYWPFVRLYDNYGRRATYGFERAFKGFDRRAYWGLNKYLADIVIPVLKKLETDSVGHPCGKTEKQWKLELKKMRQGFEAYKNSEDCDKLRYQQLQKIQDKGLKLFAENFNSLWD